MKNNWLLTSIIAILVGSITFCGGMAYQKNKTFSRSDFQAMRGMRQGNKEGDNSTRPQGANIVRGEIIEKDNNSITVKLMDNSSKLVLVSKDTDINKAIKGSLDDLKKGQTIMVFGEDNTDGSVNAKSIQLNSIPSPNN